MPGRDGAGEQAQTAKQRGAATSVRGSCAGATRRNHRGDMSDRCRLRCRRLSVCASDAISRHERTKPPLAFWARRHGLRSRVVRSCTKGEPVCRFVAFCRRRGWLAADVAVGVDRRREPADRTRAIPYAQLERLWRRSDVAVREKALWRLLYETAARASEVLSLDVGDVDLENRRAVVRSKGGDLELLHFQTGSARLLPRLIGGRSSGPVFLTDRRPAPGRAPAHRRCVPGDGSCAAVVPSRGGDLPRRVGRLDAASAAPLGDHASRRGQRRARAADGQEPPHEPALAAALRPARAPTPSLR